MTTKQEALEALAEIDSFIDGGGPRLERSSATLRQFIESAWADSERYRWLRQHFDDIWWNAEGEGVRCVRALGVAGESAPRLDAAIDAALAARSPQPGDMT